MDSIMCVSTESGPVWATFLGVLPVKGEAVDLPPVYLDRGKVITLPRGMAIYGTLVGNSVFARPAQDNPEYPEVGYRRFSTVA